MDTPCSKCGALIGHTLGCELSRTPEGEAAAALQPAIPSIATAPRQIIRNDRMKIMEAMEELDRREREGYHPLPTQPPKGANE